eukprot:363243-Chlamydomonas_euryale.AAC.3
MAARQDRHASAQLLHCCCKRRHIRDGKIAVALACASNDAGLTEGGSTLLLDRPCQDPCRVFVLSLTTAGYDAVTGTLLLQEQYWAEPHRGYRSAETLCTHGHTHMGVVLPGRQLLSGDMLDTIGHHGRT